jgi:hypothetical protein
MEPRDKPQSSFGPALFATWLVAFAAIVSGAALPLAILVALILTLLFFNLSRHPSRRVRHWNPSAPAKSPRTRIGSALLKIREMRRRTRSEHPVRFAIHSETRAGPIRTLTLPPLKEMPQQPALPTEDRCSGVLTLLALAAALLTCAALVFETSRLIEFNAKFYVFAIIDIVSVTLLPLAIGIFARYEIHSILTMISLSAATQATIFRLTIFLPDWLFLGLAAITLSGIPLGLVILFGRIDRVSVAGGIETTAGKLLRGQRLRRESRDWSDRH